MKTINILNFLFAGLILFAYTSCEKDETPDAPELPPAASLSMDFSDFSDSEYGSSTTKFFSGDQAGLSYGNYAHAALTVTGWSIAAALVTTIPTISYAAILETEPVYMGDNSWQWETTFAPEGSPDSYSARLTAERVSNEEYKAEMYISKSGALGYEDFKWFEGTIRYDKTHASWTLYENPSNPNAVLDVEWNKDWEKETYDIAYTNVKEAGTEYGSYIMFEVLEDMVFDARYTITHTQNTVLIEWNRENKSGHVKDPGKFGDEEWHCWDENYLNTDCQ
jgi:hypothetical protein